MAPMLSTDPAGLLLDAGGDLDISAGRLQFASGLAGFAQGANARIQLIRGEWFLDRALGVPYIEGRFVTADQALIGQPFLDAKARQAFTAAIAATPGFGSISSMTIAIDKVTRRMTVTWSARTAFGDVASTVEAG